MIRREQWLSVLSLAVLLSPVACSSTAGFEDPAVHRESILNGTSLTSQELNTYGLVAIYHPGDDGVTTFIRPCSGTILASGGGRSTVLTARHCLTPHGDINETPVAASKLKLIATTNPGIANPNPPAGTVTATSIQVSPIAATGNLTESDLALINVPADWSTHVTSKLGLWVSGSAQTPSTVTLAMGYGISALDWQCTDSSTAGTARKGGPFTRNGSAQDPTWHVWTYGVTNPNSGGQGLNCGDSGGPDFVQLSLGSVTYTVQIGVHSDGGNGAAHSAGISLWLQQALGGTFLSPATATSSRLYRAFSTHTVVGLVSNANTTGWIYALNDAVIYDPSQEDIDQDWCLDVNGSNNVVASLCNGSAKQKWYPDSTLRIHNATMSGLCLTSTGTAATVSSCSTASTQAWVFHPQR